MNLRIVLCGDQCERGVGPCMVLGAHKINICNITGFIPYSWSCVVMNGKGVQVNIFSEGARLTDPPSPPIGKP